MSIYDAVRDDDERSPYSSTDEEPKPPPPPSVASYSASKPPVAAPIVPPTVISSKAYMLSTAEDLAAGVACDGDEEEDECATAVGVEEDGIVQWTLKYVDKGLDEIEKEKPAQAEVAWKVGAQERAFV